MKYEIKYIKINNGACSYSTFSEYADGVNELKNKIKNINDSDYLIRFTKVYKIYKDFRHIDVTSKYIDWGGYVRC